jgi:hypothetical protein
MESSGTVPEQNPEIDLEFIVVLISCAGELLSVVLHV